MIKYQKYNPFGEPLKKNNYQPQWNERLGYIDQEKDRESKLGDHGVRKYDYEIGRFTSVDPLWEKYTGWTGYQYSLNNPVNASDGNGKVIHKQNILKDASLNDAWDKSIDFLKSLNSPTINDVLSIAEGKNSNIYINSFSINRPISGKTKSNVGRKDFLEVEWNKSFFALGMTLKSSSKKDIKADIIIGSEVLGNCILDDGSFNNYAISPIVIIDELNHAISKTQNNEKQEHLNLFKPLLNEIQNNKITLPKTLVDQIEEKVKNP